MAYGSAETYNPFLSSYARVFRLKHQPLPPRMSIEEASIMCSPDNEGGQSSMRAPLKAIPTPQTASSSSAQTLEASTSMNPSQMNGTPTQLHQWPSTAAADIEVKEMPPAEMNGNVPVSSFELEDTTISSGGTSWTLRVPWLRSKRHRKGRLDDENSSIQTLAPSLRSMHKPSVPGADQSSVYYGGLMKTAAGQITPTFVSVEAGNLDAPEGHGQYRTTARESQPSRVLQQQRQPQRQAKPTTKQRRRLSNTKISSQKPQTALELDQALLSHNNTHVPQLPAVAAAAAANTTATSYTAGAPHRLILQSAAPLEPKNTNKVFRNRSWISTSSRESNGRHNEMDEDSLADFDEAEWTPQDSAYGAAIPVCGWVPKRLRQGIEATIISFAVFVLVYLIVKTSINISESKEIRASYNNTASSNGKGYDNGLDDDWYVENSHSPNDDDYFDSYNSYNRDGDNGNGRNGNHGG
jgi:hypothetical protein